MAARPPPRAGEHLPPAVPRRLHVPRRGGAGPLPRAPRRHGRLFLAHPPRQPRQPARLRHLRPQRAEPGDRLRGGLPRFHRRAGGQRHGPAPGLRAEPHGHGPRREPLVEGRARERPLLPARPLLRHRLAARQGGTARQGAVAGARRPIRRGAGEGGTEARVPRRRALAPVFRLDVPGQPAREPVGLPPEPRRPARRAAAGRPGPARVPQRAHSAGEPAPLRRARPRPHRGSPAREGGGASAQ
jgi:hypothetical protein